MNDARVGPPYGPPGHLTAIFAAWRERGLPASVDRRWLERIGLSSNLATRNLHALRFLRLIDAAHRPTELAEKLRLAPADELRTTLAAVVRTAYARIWSLVDPASDQRARIDDAFRHESPAGQRARMVTCFIGLCGAAGIPVAGLGPHARTDSTRAARSIHRPVADRRGICSPANGVPESGDAVALLLAKLPDFDPAWPAAVAEKWLDAFARCVDRR